MKPITKRFTIKMICLILFGMPVCLSVATPDAFAGVPTKQCYPHFYDQDEDGYADLGPLDRNDERFTVEINERALNCPAGYVSKADDCDDDMRSVHPGRSEVGYNGIDDNCDEKTDEPTFEYFARGNLNTTTSFRMSVFLNHRDILNAALANVLYVEVKYARLSHSANETTLPKAPVLSYGGSFNALLSLWSLNPSTVYRAKVTFFRRNPNLQYEEVGPSSGWYYTMTDGAPGKPHTRALIVLKGLKEYSDSSTEKVGYHGTEADGTRYGGRPNEKWCTEFYVWVAQAWMPGVAGFSTVQRLIDFFESYNSHYAASEIPSRAAPGDYLPLDTDKDGDRNHSAMFLAYDASQNPVVIWTLEGNHSNKVAVAKREFDYSVFKLVNTGVASVWVSNNPVFRGLGYILSGMLQ